MIYISRLCTRAGRLFASINLSLFVVFACLSLGAILFVGDAQAQRRRASSGITRAVVADERLAALRAEPDWSAMLVQRLSHGKEVIVTGTRRSADGVIFNRVVVSRRTRGWVQAESLVSPKRAGDDERLLRLARGSEGFDRIEVANLLVTLFPRSPLRPQALLLLGDAASEAAARLTRDARRRLTAAAMASNPAPPHSYMLNFRGLDRYNRAGLRFNYDRVANRFYYDGAGWREIVHRYPASPEAALARERLKRSDGAAGNN